MSENTFLPDEDRPKVATYKMSDLEEGSRFEFEDSFSLEDIDCFARLSGDYSPLHVDQGFGVSRGFSGRVVHGVLLAALVSRLVGVHLPGANALLQSVNLRFHASVYAGEAVRVCGVIDQLSAAMRTMVIKVTIDDVATGEARVKGKVQVGFTAENNGGI